MKRVRLLIWGLVAIAAAGLAVLVLSPRATQSGQPSTASVSLGGPFNLTGADGRPFSSSQLAGQPYAIFFGFTHCPDVCPTTLARLVRLRNRMQAGAEPFTIVFVTVDPERDGPKEVASYTSLFGAPVVGLTGTPAQIAQVKRQFGIFSQNVPDEDGGYTVDHTATVLLFDRKGAFVATISPEEGDGPALDKLKRLTS